MEGEKILNEDITWKKKNKGRITKKKDIKEERRAKKGDIRKSVL